MLRRKLYRNCTTGIPEYVLFIESWVIDFGLFEILIRRNWIYDDGKVRKADHQIKQTLSALHLYANGIQLRLKYIIKKINLFITKSNTIYN